MKVAYFDCVFGAAGDMLVASLLASGLNESQWLAELNKIAIPGEHFEVEVENVLRCSILAKKVTVKCEASEGNGRHAHRYDQNSSEQDNVHEHHQHRRLSDILRIIDDSSISRSAKKLAAAIFANLAESESRVHGVTPEEVHFHEVGAVDAIVDVVGFAIGYDMLGIDSAVVSHLTLGRGVIETEHGIFPVPGPAVLYLIEKAKAPTTALDIPYECLTPTGAAILTTIAERYGAPPAFEQIQGTGYGAGSLNPLTHPNSVRVIVGNCASGSNSPRFRSEVIAVIEANIDDCSPQVLAYVLEKCLREGALDACLLPATMKKSRSGHLLSVLAKPEDRLKLQDLILSETSSIGVRSHFVERLVAERDFVQVEIPDIGSIRVKIARDHSGAVINAQPEYKDCADLAAASSLPLKAVLERAIHLYRQGCASGNNSED